MPVTTSDLETYTRTIVVPVRPLTQRKEGILNRQMKHYLRVRQYAAEYLQQPGVSALDVGYSERNELRKEISARPDVEVYSGLSEPAIQRVVQNYEEFEKASSASEPWPECANVAAYRAQTAYLFANDGCWYLCLPAKNGDLILPLNVSTDQYHQQILPDPESAPDTGRRPGVALASFERDELPGSTAGLGECAIIKTGSGEFEVHFSVHFEKRVQRSVSEPRYLVGVDRGRTELFYAALYDRDRDRVLAWDHLSGDEIEHHTDQYAARIAEYQASGALKQIPTLRNRRRRYTRQKDYEAAKAIVDLAREARTVGGLDGERVAIVLEELSGMNRLGAYAQENRRFNRWSHYRLEQAVEDKAEPYDIPVTTIRPEFTSQNCSRCGADDTRRSGVHFECRACGYEQHADANAAVNIAKRHADNL